MYICKGLICWNEILLSLWNDYWVQTFYCYRKWENRKLFDFSSGRTLKWDQTFLCCKRLSCERGLRYIILGTRDFSCPVSGFCRVCGDSCEIFPRLRRIFSRKGVCLRAPADSYASPRAGREMKLLVPSAVIYIENAEKEMTGNLIFCIGVFVLLSPFLVCVF